jgi:hypothetical protein
LPSIGRFTFVSAARAAHFLERRQRHDRPNLSTSGGIPLAIEPPWRVFQYPGTDHTRLITPSIAVPGQLYDSTYHRCARDDGWSYQLLSEESILFGGLRCLRGLLGQSSKSAPIKWNRLISALCILDLLSRLIDKSLVMPELNDQMRYHC